MANFHLLSIFCFFFLPHIFRIVFLRSVNPNQCIDRFSIAVTKLTHVKRERAIGMLHATVTPSVVTKRFRCNVRTIGRLKNRFQQIWTMSECPRPGRPCVFTRCQYRDIRTSHLRNRFHLETVTDRTYPGNHNPRSSAQTVRNRLQEICLRP